MSSAPAVAVATAIHSAKRKGDVDDYAIIYMGFFVIIFFMGIVFGSDVINNFLGNKPLDFNYLLGIIFGFGVYSLDFLNRASFNFDLNAITLTIVIVVQGSYSLFVIGVFLFLKNLIFKK